MNSFKKWRVVRYTEGEESTLESDIINKESDLDKVTTYQDDINKKEQKILQFERLKEDAKPTIPVADVKQEIKKEQKVSFLETESIPKVKTKKSSKKIKKAAMKKKVTEPEMSFDNLSFLNQSNNDIIQQQELDDTFDNTTFQYNNLFTPKPTKPVNMNMNNTNSSQKYVPAHNTRNQRQNRAKSRIQPYQNVISKPKNKSPELIENLDGTNYQNFRNFDYNYYRLEQPSLQFNKRVLKEGENKDKSLNLNQSSFMDTDI